jgi:hypothetical protein
MRIGCGGCQALLILAHKVGCSYAGSGGYLFNHHRQNGSAGMERIHFCRNVRIHREDIRSSRPAVYAYCMARLTHWLWSTSRGAAARDRTMIRVPFYPMGRDASRARPPLARSKRLPIFSALEALARRAVTKPKRLELRQADWSKAYPQSWRTLLNHPILQCRSLTQTYGVCFLSATLTSRLTNVSDKLPVHIEMIFRC